MLRARRKAARCSTRCTLRAGRCRRGCFSRRKSGSPPAASKLRWAAELEGEEDRALLTPAPLPRGERWRSLLALVGVGERRVRLQAFHGLIARLGAGVGGLGALPAGAVLAVAGFHRRASS